MSKNDPVLGKQVATYLLSKGVETPMTTSVVESDANAKVARLETLFQEIWETVGLDMSDDSLCDTPKRMAKMYVHEIYSGLDYRNFPKCTVVDNKMHYDEMVVEKNITVMSNCEHHGVTIAGVAHVAYIPDQKVLGLSKLNRIVDFFSKRPQIQERLTEQVYHALSFILGTDNIAVCIAAEHYCVKARGVRDTGSSTVTSKLGGDFKNHSARAEFMALSR
jgi:GTP cyclohydrolase I